MAPAGPPPTNTTLATVLYSLILKVSRVILRVQPCLSELKLNANPNDVELSRCNLTNTWLNIKEDAFIRSKHAQ